MVGAGKNGNVVQPEEFPASVTAPGGEHMKEI